MATSFRGEKGVTRVRVLPRGTTENSESYTENLRCLNVLLRRIHPTRKMLEMLLLHDIRPNISARTTLAVTELGWRLFLHALYSPDLALSDFHLFDALNDRLQKQNLVNDAHCRAVLQ
jgi:histone-lysine N-methyltransferase SETMAR